MNIVHDTICDFLAPHITVVDKHDWKTQVVVYYAILSLGGMLLYLFFAGLSFLYSFVLRRETYYPPTIPREKLLEQVKYEIGIALSSLWQMAVLMLPGAFFAHRGYSKLYYDLPSDTWGWVYFFGSVPAFIMFTDMVIYFFHRGLHHPLLYRRFHKLHHSYQYTTPFSSHAFHPVDGFAQGSPYYIFIYLFPFHNVQFLLMFFIVNIWTISIHDQVDFGSKVLSSTGHHTIHHADFWYNYGQYTTLWDRLCGTYKPAVQTHDFLTGKRLAKKAVE